MEKETGEEMAVSEDLQIFRVCYHLYLSFFSQIWLPPTPPTDDVPEYYLDYTLEMAYDTISVMTPDELMSTAIYR